MSTKTPNIIVFALPGNEDLARGLVNALKATLGEVTTRRFPDGESYVRILSDVKDKCVVIVATLARPDEKLLPLYFLSKTAKKLGAHCTCLVAPYLAYMRQDKAFNEGEGVTSAHFAELTSGFADMLITVDPHLHRRKSLGELYSIPSTVVHAAESISAWIKENVSDPVLIGPDSESEQWVSEVAKGAGAPFTVLSKVRHGDREVEVSIPDIEAHKDRAPVLVDDIISTAQTMIATVRHLKRFNMKAPVCVGVHAVFAENAYQDLIQAGAGTIATCNTIPHPSNAIDLTKKIAEGVASLMRHSGE